MLPNDKSIDAIVNLLVSRILLVIRYVVDFLSSFYGTLSKGFLSIKGLEKIEQQFTIFLIK